MKFIIYCDGEIIAEFKYSHDRDACLDALKDLHEDCEFQGGLR